MTVLKTLEERGFVQQITHPEELEERLSTGSMTYYVGIDPTADSMHVGHLLPVMAMAHLQRAGHSPIAVVGGGTAMVGDPSGKTEMRQMMTRERIQTNVDALKAQLSHFLEFGEGKGRLVDNAEWLLELNYVEFLRDIGRLFSVNRMLSAEAYKQRLERGLSFIEFNYQLLQAYDFLELNRRYGCELQMGGDDQWGNIVAGADLIRRKEQGRGYGLTQPLIMTSTGQKMGKTAGGAVWLDPNKLKPFDYYQYWLNIPDADVGRMLKLYTFLPMEQIAELEALTGKDVRRAKAVLAKTATAQVHGEDEAASAERGASAMVSGASTDAMPSHTVSADALLVDVLVDAGMTKSKGEGRRLIKGGGVKVDQVKIADTDFAIAVADLGEGRVIRLGKKRAIRLISA